VLDNSLEFIFAFLPVTLAGYLAIGKVARMIWLAALVAILLAPEPRAFERSTPGPRSRPYSRAVDDALQALYVMHTGSYPYGHMSPAGKQFVAELLAKALRE
jgi:hypothetical protein